jgi:hypothetical protein
LSQAEAGQPSFVMIDGENSPPFICFLQTQHNERPFIVF